MTESQFRICLDPLTKSELEYARQLRNKFRKSFFIQYITSPEQQQQWFKNIYLRRKREDYTLFIVRLVTTGEPVGTTSFSKLTEDIYELGNNIIDDDYQGRGYFTEVYKLMKEKIGGKGFAAKIFRTNHRMLDIYKHLGFEARTDTEKDNLVTMMDY